MLKTKQEILQSTYLYLINYYALSSKHIRAKHRPTPLENSFIFILHISYNMGML